MPISRAVGLLKAVHESPAGGLWVDAGRLSLDFTMTGPWPGLGAFAQRWEGLHAPGDLADWFSACELRLGRIDVAPSDLSEALQLRDALWGLTRAHLERRPHPRQAVTTVNAYAAGSPLVPQLRSTGRSWARPTAGQALATIARDAVELYADAAQLARLRECSSDDCRRPFFDTSRPGTRRWCDPVRCGDRQRARAYRVRTHADGTTPQPTPVSPA